MVTGERRSRPSAHSSAPSGGRSRPGRPSPPNPRWSRLATASPATLQRSCHTVVKDDTVYSLAKKFGVTQDALRKANGMTDNELPLGKQLVIPDGKACSVQHTVGPDDTLYSLSKRYGVSVAEIQKANGLGTSTKIQDGQVLSIPTTAAQPAAPAPAKPAPAPAKPPATAPTPAKPPATAPAPAKPPATPAAKPAVTPGPASTSADPGHDPGRDYVDGTLREDSFLRDADKKTVQLSGKAKLFFKKGDSVKRTATSGDWVEVEGTAYTGKPPVAAGTHKGWIQRVWTSMSFGDYKDVPVDDRTETYGGLAAGSLKKSDVNSVILHQTGGAVGASTLSGYAGNIKAKRTIGAHYLIDETGAVILTVPVDKSVSHVGKTKPGFDKSSNSHAIGIEHSGAEAALEVPKDSKDTVTLKKNRDSITAMAMAPAFKARLLAMNDKQLFGIARDNRSPKDKTVWNIYGDIKDVQKRSSFLLVSKLMADFGLAEADLLPHETVSWKSIGEGENIKEFLTARFAYDGLVAKLEKLVKADAKLVADAALAKIVSDEKATMDALALDATDAENKALAAEKAAGKPSVATAREGLRTSYYTKFWQRSAQLADLVAFVETSGSTQPAGLAKKTGAWVK